MRETILRLNNLNYSGADESIHQISIRLEMGEVGTLFGLHHSGQELLAHIIAGNIVARFEPGAFWFRGRYIRRSSELKNAVYFITQQISRNIQWTTTEFIELTNARWVLFPAEKAKMDARVRKLFQTFDVDLNPERKISELSLLERIQAEILRAYELGIPLVCIENLEKLTAYELERLRELLNRMKRNGVTYLIVCHSAQVASILSDRCYVLQNGYVLRNISGKRCNMAELGHFMMGAAIEKKAFELDKYSRTSVGSPTIVYEVFTNVTGEIHWRFRASEITEIVASSYERRLQIFNILSGRSSANGTIRYMNGKPIRGRQRDMLLKHKIVGLEKVGSRNGMFPNMSIRDNVLLPSLFKLSELEYIRSRSGFQHMLMREIRGSIDEPDDHKKLSAIPRIEQLHVSLIRWLIFGPKVLILFDPMRAADLYERSIICAYLKRFANRGVSVILVTVGGEDTASLTDRVIRLP